MFYVVDVRVLYSVHLCKAGYVVTRRSAISICHLPPFWFYFLSVPRVLCTAAMNRTKSLILGPLQAGTGFAWWRSTQTWEALLS